MFKKGTKIYSVTNSKCPRCHEGDFFKYKFTLNPSKITQLHDNCPKCDLRYMMEPSFFFGAMYVNYGLTVAISIATFLIATLLFSLTLLQSFAAIIIALLVLTPLNLRLSRIIWINMFVSYKKSI
ncbi:DUF983 domain-containing protein [Polaribacter sp. ALD11]|uniref:DUF983 domain-containing protein n=1 Tax=Polaribacter sp. ALD11 TaxID=2058137 RepID=UPI000C309C3B|nr:DUF983 domain-containing protein [Polaribacter sp. ALD11]AUC86138.1 DUF983 domain-containing protein [Polaribacter sp. ALD11]